MPKTTPLFNSFVAGELSPRLLYRTDLPFYYQGCRSLQNFIAIRSGGVRRRPGLYYAGIPYTSTSFAWLQPYDRYVVEFTSDRVRVWDSDDHALEDLTGTGTTSLETNIIPANTVMPYLKTQEMGSTLYVVHYGYAPAKLVEGSAAWTFSNVSVTAGTGDESFDAADHYPNAICAHQQRLMLGGTVNDPGTIWGSKIGLPEDFTTGSSDDAAFEYGIAGAGWVQWLVALDDILVGAVNGEWKMTGHDAAITPTNVDIKRQTTYGSLKPSQGVAMNDAALFIQKGGRLIREMEMKEQVRAYHANDISAYADHIGLAAAASPAGTAPYSTRGFKQLALQTSPYPILWAVCADGTLACCVYDKRLGVLAWSRIVTDGYVESVCVVPTNTGEDEVWVSVYRGVTDYERTIEYFKPMEVLDDSAVDDLFYVDGGITQDQDTSDVVTNVTKSATCQIVFTSGNFANDDKIRIIGVVGMTELNYNVYTLKNKSSATYDLYTQDGTTQIDSSGFTAYDSKGAAEKVTNTVSGLDHLEGKTVGGLGDGNVLATETVSTGAVTLDSYYAKVQIGLLYESYLQPMPIEAGAMLGTAQGKKKRIYRLWMALQDTINGKFGPALDNLRSIIYKVGDRTLGSAPPLYNGDKQLTFEGEWETIPTLFVYQQDPVPMTILSVVPEIQTHDKSQ